MNLLTSGAPKRLGLCGLVLGLGLGLAACGTSTASPSSTSTDSTSADAGAPSAGPTASPSPTYTATAVALAQPTSGLVELDGSSDKLTRASRKGFTTARLSGLDVSSSGESRAFQRLCVGDVDVVDSSRSMTAQEYAQCQADGLRVVQLEVAADGIVLAIKSQTDVGADCLSTDQIRAAFRSGSTVNRWSDLGGGLDDVSFGAGGPSVASDVASFFGTYILGDPNPVSTDFRNDYHVTQTEPQTKQFVTGSARDARLAATYSAVRPLWNSLRTQYRSYQGVLAGKQLAVEKAVRNRAKGIRDNRSVKQQALDEARKQAAYVDRATWIDKLHAVRARFRPIDQRYQVVHPAYQRLVASYGRVGLFSEGYYATYEDQLRPFEVQVSDGDNRPNCIFPSPETILNGQYPLSRPILLTTTTRALGRTEVRQYLEHYLQRAAANSSLTGLVPLPQATLNREYAWLDGSSPTPTFAPDATGALVEQTSTPTVPGSTSSASPTAPGQPAR